MKKGITLTEMLVALVIMGVLLSVSIPMITNSIEQTNKPLFKSAYNNISTVINELINDVSIYPSGEFSNDTFCSNFFAKINTIGTASCAPSTIPDSPNSITTNSMRWYNVEDDFRSDTCPSGATGQCIMISVDINGSSKGNSDHSSDDKNQDILDIYVFSTGKTTVESSTIEATYLTE